MRRKGGGGGGGGGKVGKLVCLSLRKHMLGVINIVYNSSARRLLREVP